MEAEVRDFLSDLPDSVLHHIFSFLKDNDIARLTVLSRRFQTLCIASPFFCFSQPHHSSSCSCSPVSNFMNTVLQHRPHALKINQLSFSSFCKKRRHGKLHVQWINELFEAFHVDELSLHYKLPSIFRSLSGFQSLKVLTLKMGQVSPVQLLGMKLTSLETLSMESIATNDLVGEWVSQSFPSLKRLFLVKINIGWPFLTKQDLTVQSSCLEDLTIHYCCNFKPVRIIAENLRTFSFFPCELDCLHEVDEDELVVEISAPNLQSFSWIGPPKRLCYGEGTFKNLHLGVISELIISSTNLNLFIQSVEAIRWARILHTEMAVLRDLYLDKIPISFENLRHLEIEVQCLGNEHDVVIPFLERTSNLETLTLMNSPPDFEGPSDPSIKYTLKNCRKVKLKKIKGLKKVKCLIRDLNGSMLRVIWLLMKWCIDLEEMTLCYRSCDRKCMNLAMHVMKAASSALSIYLLPQSLPF